MKKKIVVIGSGFGGLAAAIRMQARGCDVTLLEKNAAVGGHASQLQHAGYTFDMGPSLVTAPDIIRSVFDAAGARMEDEIDLVPLDPFYRIFFHDGSYIDYSGDAERMKSQMAKFNRQDADRYDAFMEACREIYEAVIVDGLGRSPFMDLRTMFNFLPRAMKLKALYPAASLVRRYFKDPRHIFTFSFHPLFIGGNPFRAPAVYLMIPWLEKTGGVWYSKGGMYSIVKAFERVFLRLGGKIETGCEARKVHVVDKKATGVATDRGTFPADAVISNADWAHTHLDLIDGRHRRKWSDRRVASRSYSMSAFLLYLGVRKRYDQLKHHTIILSERYKGLISDIFDRKILPDDFSMYLHNPSLTDASMAPDGCDSVYILIPVPNTQAGIDWDAEKQRYAQRIMSFLEHDFGLEGFVANTDILALYTPQDFARERNNYHGAAWGIEPKLTQTAFFRPHNRSEEIENLYFVGASTHPGAGVPGVLLTAETTEGVISRDMGLERPALLAEPEAA